MSIKQRQIERDTGSQIEKKTKKKNIKQEHDNKRQINRIACKKRAIKKYRNNYRYYQIYNAYIIEEKMFPLK